MTSTLALQSAIFITLKNDPALDGVGVWDDAPASAAYPYIVMGFATEGSTNTMNEVGREATVTIHIWSRYLGMKECKEIAGKVITILDSNTLSVQGWNVSLSRYEFSDFRLDPDGESRHGTLRFRYQLQQE